MYWQHSNATYSPAMKRLKYELLGTVTRDSHPCWNPTIPDNQMSGNMSETSKEKAKSRMHTYMCQL